MSQSPMRLSRALFDANLEVFKVWLVDAKLMAGTLFGGVGHGQVVGGGV